MIEILKLNQNYEPVAVIGVRKAIRLVCLEKAEIVKEYDDKFIRTSQTIFKIPAVIRLLSSYSRPKKGLRFNRKNVFLRDRFKCQYCGERFSINELTLDHIIPRSQGGKTSFENCVACCSSCNDKKRNRTPLQANMNLKSIPIRPDWVPYSIFLNKNNISDEWKDYCFYF